MTVSGEPFAAALERARPQPANPEPVEALNSPDSPKQSFMSGKKRKFLAGLACIGASLCLGGETQYSVGAIEESSATTLKFATWNVKGKALKNYDTILKTIKAHDLAAFALQEVNAEDEEPLQALLAPEGIHVTFTMGDRRQNFFQGGQGNMILTKGQPKRVVEDTFEGMSDAEFATSNAAAAGQDIFRLAATSTQSIAGMIIKRLETEPDTSFRAARKALKESRSFTSLTNTYNINDRKIDIRVGNVHLPDNKFPPLRKKQVGEFEEALEEETDDKVAMVLLGDFNTPPEELTTILADHRMSLATPLNELSTSLKDDVHRIIDNGASYSAGVLENGIIQTLRNPSRDELEDSDHRRRIMTITIKPE